MLDIVIPIVLLATSFLFGALFHWLAVKFKVKLMLYFYGKPAEPKTSSERLEKLQGVWLGLRALLCSWRAGLSAKQYFAAILLCTEIDELLEVSDKRKTKIR